jgi:hypothetical protein
LVRFPSRQQTVRPASFSTRLATEFLIKAIRENILILLAGLAIYKNAEKYSGSGKIPIAEWLFRLRNETAGRKATQCGREKT